MEHLWPETCESVGKKDFLLDKKNRKEFKIKIENVQSKSKIKILTDARALISFYAYVKVGINGSKISNFLNVSRPAVSKSIQKGKEIKNERKLIS